MYESKRRVFLFLFIAIASAFAAVLLFAQYVERIERELGEQVGIQTAGEAIAVGTVITADMLQTIKLPRKYVVDSFLTTGEEAVGKMALVQIPPGEVLTQAMLGEMRKLPDDYRLVQLRAPIAVFDEQLDVLDRVDVIGTYDKRAGEQSLAATSLEQTGIGDGRTTEILLRDIPVIRVYKEGEEIVSIGVALTLEQARQVVWLQNFGKEVRVLKGASRLASAEEVKQRAAGKSGDYQ